MNIIKDANNISHLDVHRTDTGLVILHGIENYKEHISISHKSRNPTWDEIKLIRYKLLSSSKTYALILPPLTEYVNVHKYCFHLWEIDT